MKKSVFFFTLVELLTVIAVIAILAGIAVPVIVGMSNKGKETTARADMNSIKLALTQFKSDYSVWPISGSADVFYSAAFTIGESGRQDASIDTMMQELTMISINPGSNDAPQAYTPSLNTKKRKYLDVPAKPVEPIEPNGSVKKGFFKIDPWGRRYNIAIDNDYNKKLILTKKFLRVDDNDDPEETIAGDIAIFSFGSAESATAGDADLDAFLYSWKTVAD